MTVMNIQRALTSRWNRLVRISLLLFAAGLLGCESPRVDHEAALRDIHARILQAHLDRDAEAWLALEADTLTVASRGALMLSPREERLDRRRAYLEAYRFSVYRDLQPPRIEVSDDGSQGWLFANVEVVAHSATADPADTLRTVWAWVELYERREGRWLLVGNVSNEQPGPP